MASSTKASSAQRLRVTTKWLELAVLSEPYVILTARGYAPVVRVEEGASGSEYELIIAPKSLADGLEVLRIQNDNKFEGMRLRVRKRSSEQFSQYEVASSIGLGSRLESVSDDANALATGKVRAASTRWWCDPCEEITKYRRDSGSGVWTCAECGKTISP